MKSNLTLRQLRAFVAVTEQGQFTKAASQLHITQSALSMLVRELETDLDNRLFDRHTRRVELTAFGSRFLRTARSVLESLEEAVDDGRAFAAGNRGCVTVASASVLAAHLVVPTMRAFLSDHPQVQVVLKDMPEEELYAAVTEGHCDLAVGTLLSSMPGVDESRLFSDHLMLVVPSHHPLTQLSTIGWHHATEFPFIALSSRSTIRSLIESHLAALNLRLRIAHEASLLSTLFTMVEQNMGITVLPSNARTSAPGNKLTFLPIQGASLQRVAYVFFSSQRQLHPAAALFAEKLKETVASRMEGPRATSPGTSGV